MKKVKTLRIIARLNIGGPAQHVILLTEGLDRTRFETILISGSLDKDEGDMGYYAAQKNVQPCYVDSLKRRLNPFDDIAALMQIFNIIKREHPDIVHTHTAKAGTVGRAAAVLFNLTHPFRKERIRLIHTFHGHVFSGYFNRLAAGVFVLIERSLGLFTDKIITVSESVKDELVSLGIARHDKIKVIPLGFELERFLDIAPKDTADLDIGIIGRLVPVKNHRLFLEASAKVLKDNSQGTYKFKVIGDGQLMGELGAYAQELGISKRVSFLGWQKDLTRVYSELDIVALTSKNEGTPVSLIEAMASARTVVAADVGGVKDLLGEEIESSAPALAGFKVTERGISVEPGRPESFAAALGFALKNSALRKDIGERARSFVKERFTKQRLIKDIEGLYEEVLRKKYQCAAPVLDSLQGRGA